MHNFRIKDHKLSVSGNFKKTTVKELALPMKYILLFALLLSLASCKKCPECFNISEPIRIIYINESGENLLADGTLEPKQITLQNASLDLPFTIKDYVVNGSKEKAHIELVNEELHEECIDNDCVLIIEFENNFNNDTLIYSIVKSKADCCTSYNVSKFIYNGVSYLGKDENTIGAYVILK